VEAAAAAAAAAAAVPVDSGRDTAACTRNDESDKRRRLPADTVQRTAERMCTEFCRGVRSRPIRGHWEPPGMTGHLA